MRLNIGSLVGKKGESFSFEKELPNDFIQFTQDVKGIGPVLVQLTVTNTGEGYLVVGEVKLDVSLRCSRCLKPIQTKLIASIEEEYLHRPPSEVEDLWDETPLVEANELDLSELLEESILMSVPMKAICQDDCPGLCPTCGADLSVGACECLSPDIDIRLAPLSELLHSLETKSPERRKDHGSTKEKTFKSKD